MSSKELWIGPITMAMACLVSAGCSGGGGAGVAVAPAAAGGGIVPDCPADFVIDDFHDGNNQILVQEGRKGYWYTFVDKVGTTISPPAGKKFIMSTGGINGDPFAARMIGKVSASGDPQYAGLGFSFTNPKADYDASKYTGVAFWAKVGPGSMKQVRLKVPDVNTDPDGKVCTECFNDFGVDLDLTEEWTKYTVPFDKMSQLEGWGSPQKDKVEPKKLYGMQWQVNKPGQSFDLWISDVSFVGCK